MWAVAAGKIYCRQWKLSRCSQWKLTRCRQWKLTRCRQCESWIDVDSGSRLDAVSVYRIGVCKGNLLNVDSGT
jgi:hypothetical protein